MTDMTPEPTPALVPTEAPAPTSTDPDRHQLPSGGWVVLGDYRNLSGSDVKAVLGVVLAGVPYGTNRVRMLYVLLGRLVRNWSFEHLPLPATEKVLDMLTAPDLLALFDLVQAPFDLINGKNVKPVMTPETMVDPGSPSQGSSE